MKNKGKLNEFLEKFESKYENPWKSKGFSLWFMECFMSTENYSIRNVEIFFKEKSIVLHFFDEDFLIGLFVATRIICCPYDMDKDMLIIFNKHKIKIDNWKDRLNEVFIFNLLFQKISPTSSELNEIEFLTSETFIEFQKKSIYFIVDKDHDDFYYANLEIKKREKFL